MVKNKEDGIWLEDLFSERLSGTEKLWRDIYRTADEFQMMVRLDRYPLVLDMQQYVITIGKVKKGKWIKIYSFKGMELEPLLKQIKKTMEKYKLEHKEYLVQRPGGGEMI